jgi:Ca-activated chloride channel homolog
MVVAPRYIPGRSVGKQGGGFAPDTNQVPDGSKITPQVTPSGIRAGHDISIELALDAGVPLLQLNSVSHEIEVDRTGASSATVRLRNLTGIPNQDFVLKYEVAGEQIAALLSQAESQTVSRAKSAPGGYFTLILQPPSLPESDVTPKELVFVLDTSGSMMGFPIEKAKNLINHALDELYPGDTFNLITFSGDTRILFPEPVYPTAQNIRKAREILNAQHGSGGTEMMGAIQAALTPSDSQDHLRVVCFLTDGEVGNDLGIIGEIQKHPNARVFAYGIGNSVNRFLITSMAKAGRGDSEVVTLNDKADEAALRLYQRLRSPVLTDISIDWRGLPVAEVFPTRLPDLFTGQPLVVSGRYTASADGSIVIHGKRAGEDFTREIPVHLNSTASADSTLSNFWARRKIDDLMSQDWADLQTGTVKPEVLKEITQLGLSYRLITQFTSFVAVEERIVTTDGKPQRIEVPVEMPDGMSYEGVFGTGGDKQFHRLATSAKLNAAKSASFAVRGIGSGSGAGCGPALTTGAAALAPPPSPTPSEEQALSTPYRKWLDEDEVYILTDQQRAALAVPRAMPEVAQPAPTPDAKPPVERALLESKLSPAVLAQFDCWKKQSSDCKQGPDGTIEVQLFLIEDPSALVEKLKAIGLEVSQVRSKEKLVIGRLPLDKLTDLAKLQTLKFVTSVRR